MTNSEDNEKSFQRRRILWVRLKWCNQEITLQEGLRSKITFSLHQEKQTRGELQPKSSSLAKVECREEPTTLLKAATDYHQVADRDLIPREWSVRIRSSNTCRAKSQEVLLSSHTQRLTLWGRWRGTDEEVRRMILFMIDQWNNSHYRRGY